MASHILHLPFSLSLERRRPSSSVRFSTPSFLRAPPLVLAPLPRDGLCPRSLTKYNIMVVVSDFDSSEEAVQHFEREVARAGIVYESKRRRFFENKQDKKKRKIREAIRRNRRRRNFFARRREGVVRSGPQTGGATMGLMDALDRAAIGDFDAYFTENRWDDWLDDDDEYEEVEGDDEELEDADDEGDEDDKDGEDYDSPLDGDA